MKKLRILILCLALCFLVACGEKTDEKVSEGKAEEIVQNATDWTREKKIQSIHITRELSSSLMIEAQARIISNEREELPVYVAHLVVQNYDKAKEIFLKGEKIAEEQISETKDSRTNEPSRFCETNDGCILMSQGEGIFYWDESFGRISRVFNLGNGGNSAKFLTGNDLEFKSLKDAKIDVEKILQCLQISYINEPTCYTLNYNSLLEEAEKVNSFPDEGFNSEPVSIQKTDECYCFIYQTAIEGMPVSVYQNGVFGDGSWTPGTAVQCFYSEKGVISFRIEYQLKSDGCLSRSNSLTVEDAIALLDKKYNSMILEGKYVVDHIEFEYIPLPKNGALNEYTVVPAWRFSVLHTYEEQDKESREGKVTANRRSDVVFHAITGEELPMDASDA